MRKFPFGSLVSGGMGLDMCVCVCIHNADGYSLAFLIGGYVLWMNVG